MTTIARDLPRHDLWFHVDGAYGGFAAAVPGAPADLRALADADSVAVDPHKWLYAPLEAGCALVRDPRLLRDAFSYHPPYYHFDGDVTNFYDYGPQNSRGFRALKVWLALRQVGRAGYHADDRRRHPPRAAAARARAAHPSSRRDAGTQHHDVPLRAARSAARARAGGRAYLDDLNQALLTASHAAARRFSPTRWSAAALCCARAS